MRLFDTNIRPISKNISSIEILQIELLPLNLFCVKVEYRMLFTKYITEYITVRAQSS